MPEKNDVGKDQDERWRVLAYAALPRLKITHQGHPSTEKENIMTQSSKKPSHHAYTIREGDKRSGDFWTRIGAAFGHNDGKGFSLILEAMPFDGKITLRVAETKEKQS